MLRLQDDFHNWTSDNSDIDEFIKQTQLNAKTFKDIIEWIPFNKFTNIKYLAKGGFGTVFKAAWTDGFINGNILGLWSNKWSRNGKTDICLKGLDSSKDIKQGFLNEVYII
ncbi:hypothetical protein C2G38_1311844 [Gigaspora rosea]|uniref:Protein kinase domain-containing protein n=1 Tax=Gigaspora rosea TaxID=44941 RepID=A0A397VG85_9GLOM|nr:hypothetical protein C2G38_1311844 [Gigaspora rosea]